MSDPRRLDEGEATEFERRMLEAAQRQTPNPALKARMRGGLGLPSPSAAAPVVARLSAVSWKVGVVIGVVAIGAAVAVLSVRARRPPASRDTAGAVPVVAPVQAAGRPEVQDPVQPDGVARGGEGAVFDEIHLLDRAREAVSAGAPRRALDFLDEYGRRYPSGRFVPEAAALRIEALASAGDTSSAQILGRRFLSRYPANPLAQRVAKLVRR